MPNRHEPLHLLLSFAQYAAAVCVFVWILFGIYARLNLPQWEWLSSANYLDQLYTLILIWVMVCLTYYFSMSHFYKKQNLAHAPLHQLLNLPPTHEFKSTIHDSVNFIAMQKHQLLQLQKEQLQLHTILANMQEGVIAIDQNQRVLHINQRACNILDVPYHEAMRGYPLWHFIRHPEVLDMIDQSFSLMTHQNAEPVKKTIALQEFDGQKFIDVYAANAVIIESPTDQYIDNADQSFSSVVLVLHEVTTAYRLNQMRRDFVANASHELKTPTAALKMMLEELLDDATMPVNLQRSFLLKSMNQVNRLQRLINDLMDLSRIEYGYTPTLVAINLIGLVQRIIKDLDPELIARIEWTPSVDRAIILGDEKMLYQLIVNLIDNALKYSQKQVFLAILETEAEHYTFSITDQGIGISKADQARIFERFYRGDASRGDKIVGTGLGLAIVKHIAEMHHAKIDIKSQLGVGTTFSIAFEKVHA